MMLEDFFTLSEIKDGLGTLARVNELISAMQEQRDGTASIVNDVVRQWSTVAKVLAATENKDCLEWFVHLDGLGFLNYWLQEVQKRGMDSSEDSGSKLLFNILEALDRLPVSTEIFASSGIGLTLKQALSHSDILLQEKGTMLLSKWHFPSEELKDQSAEKNGSWHIVKLKVASLLEEGLQSLNSLLDSSPSKEVINHAGCDVASPGKDSENGKKVPHISSEIVCIRDVEAASLTNQQTQPSTSNSGVATGISGDRNSLTSSIMSNLSQESMSTAEESSACLATRVTSTGTTCSPLDIGKDPKNQPDFADVHDSIDVKDVNEDVHKAEHDCSKSSQKEDSRVTSYHGLSSATWNLIPLSNEHCTSGSKESEKLPPKTSDSQMDSAAECSPTYSNPGKEQNQTFGKVDVPFESAFRDIHGEMSGDGKKSRGAHLEVSKAVNLRNRYGNGGMLSRKARMEIDFGDDALEVAVQVAIEAEREVADREQCSSSLYEKSDGEVVDSGCSGLQQIEFGLSNSCVSAPEVNFTNGRSSSTNKSCRKSGNSNYDKDEHSQEPEIIKSPSSSHHSLQVTDEKRCIFDLNEDVVGCDDTDILPLHTHQNLSAPVPILATSKGSHGLPFVPFIFHGGSRWTGSAATSAFRPASPKKAVEYEKFSDSEKATLLKLDLNVADGEDAAAADMPLHLSDLPSHDSFPAVSLKRDKGITLDLNCPGDEDAFGNTYHPDVHSSNFGDNLSASSSGKHASFRGFDLNDTPAVSDVCEPPSLNKSCFKALATSESSEHDDPDVIILGSRMSTIRKELNHGWQSAMRGFPMNSSMAVRAPSMVYPYMPSSGYGYNVFGVAPNTSSLHPRPSVPTSYPYMVDSRGVSIVSQVVNSSSGFVGSPAPRPFIFGSVNNFSGLGASGSSGPSLDLNSGSFGNSYSQGHSALSEEQMRCTSLSLNSFGAGLKRKEPDSSWESHAVDYKKMPPWH